MDSTQARVMNEAPRVHAMLRDLAGEMPELHLRYPDMLLRTWELRAEAISRATPSPLRLEVLSLLGRIGIRWGLVHAVRGQTTMALDKNSSKSDLTGLRKRRGSSARSCAVARTEDGLALIRKGSIRNRKGAESIPVSNGNALCPLPRLHKA